MPKQERTCASETTLRPKKRMTMQETILKQKLDKEKDKEEGDDDNKKDEDYSDYIG